MFQQAQIVYRFVYPHASATPPAYVFIHNLCNRLGVYNGNHILNFKIQMDEKIIIDFFVIFGLCLNLMFKHEKGLYRNGFSTKSINFYNWRDGN